MSLSLINARYHGAVGTTIGHGEQHNIHTDSISAHSAEIVGLGRFISDTADNFLNAVPEDAVATRVLGLTTAPENRVIWIDAPTVTSRGFSAAMLTGLTDYVPIPSGAVTQIGAPVSGAWVDTGTLLLFDPSGLFGITTGRISFDSLGQYNISAILEWTGTNVSVNPTSGNARVTGGFRKVSLLQDPAGAATTILCICNEQSSPGATFPFIQGIEASVEVTSLAGGANIFALEVEQDSGVTQDVRVLRIQAHRFG